MSGSAIITGIYGQDGYYLAKKLFNKDLTVYGVSNKVLSVFSKKNKLHLKKEQIIINELKLDLLDFKSVAKHIKKIKPKYIFHLAALHSSSEKNLDNHEKVFFNNFYSTLNILESINLYSKKTRFIHAGSCLMFDNSRTSPQNDKTEWNSSSSYGISKNLSSKMVKHFRDNKKIFAVNAILYNHESPMRPDHFVSQKIINGLIDIKFNKKKYLTLASLDSYKDWSHAEDIVEGMVLMSNAEKPMDYIISSQIKRSVNDFVKVTADILKIKDIYKKIKIEKKIKSINNSKKPLIGNSIKIRKNLKWENKISFRDMIKEMIRYKIEYND